MEFDVAKRRNEPITFKIGGDNALLEKGYSKAVAVQGEDRTEDVEVAEVRGKDDHVYNFDPPKSAVMLMPILEVDTSNGTGSVGVDMTKATFDWLGQGLSTEDRERVIARLRDPKDDLDVDNLSSVVQGLSARVAGRPTS
jgi:hypothetical protein